MNVNPPTTFLKLRDLKEESAKLARDLTTLAEESVRSYAAVLIGTVTEEEVETKDALERVRLRKIADDFIMYGDLLHGRNDLIKREEIASAIGYIHRRLGALVPEIKTGTTLKLRDRKQTAERIRECKAYMEKNGAALLTNIDPRLLTPEGQQYIRSLLNDMKAFGGSILRGNTSPYEDDRVTKDEFTAVSGYLWLLTTQELS